MTIHHAIVAFPALDAAESIESIRRAFDPQASLLPAHITLVFPFAAPLETALREHIASTLMGVSPFDIALGPPSAEEGGYLFLRVGSGRQRIVDLHDRLYSGPLQSYLSTTQAYEPHVTVGRLSSPEGRADALAMARASLTMPLRGRIDGVALFCIENGAGRVEFTFSLGNRVGDNSDSTRSAPNEAVEKGGARELSGG
jgi:2'-5' RNA ligase